MAMTVNELISLFCEVCDDASSFARLSLRLPNRPSADDVQHFRYEASKQVERACENVETQALIIPILTGAMSHITKLYAVSLEDLLSGEFEPRRKRYETLMSELKNSEIALEWDSTYEKISEVITRLGLNPDRELLRDMPRVAEIMLSAFSFFSQYHTKIIKVSAGTSKYDKVQFITSMPRFSSVSEFYGEFRDIPLNCAVMMAMIAPTYTETTDPLNSWKDTVKAKYTTTRGWYGDERINNMRSRDKDFDPDKEIAMSSCRAVVGVKRGENVWLIIHDDESTHNGNFINFHGKRTSFMPFQVLFKNAPAPNDECTALALPWPGGWNVFDILDSEQSLWLPTFLWLLERKYFTQPVDENEPLYILDGMVRLVGHSDNPNLPAVKKSLDVKVSAFMVPDGYATGPECDEFIKHLELTGDDIADAVIVPHKLYGDEQSFHDELWVASREVLAFVAKSKLAKDYHDNHKNLNDYLIECIHNNRQFLLDELKKPDSLIHALSEHIIDNQPSVKDGQLEMTGGRYIGQQVPRIMKTAVDYTRRYYYSDYAVICTPETLSERRPPVTIILSPTTAEHLAFIAGVPLDLLPWQYRLAGKCGEANQGPFNREHPKDPMLLLDNPYKMPRAFMSFGKREYKELFPGNLLSKKEIEQLLKNAGMEVK